MQLSTQEAYQIRSPELITTFALSSSKTFEDVNLNGVTYKAPVHMDVVPEHMDVAVWKEKVFQALKDNGVEAKVDVDGRDARITFPHSLGSVFRNDKGSEEVFSLDGMRFNANMIPKFSAPIFVDSRVGELEGGRYVLPPLQPAEPVEERDFDLSLFEMFLDEAGDQQILSLRVGAEIEPDRRDEALSRFATMTLGL
ncbi:MAG: hypothetical protein ACPGRX_06175 [Bdellovibrionales bacterium]